MKKNDFTEKELEQWEEKPLPPVEALESRISAEKDRLSEQFKDVEPKKRMTVQGLIERAAFMCVTLEDCESDIKKNGVVELFSQSETQAPYTRKRPVADLYNTLNANYQKIIKQLVELLPKDAPKVVDDGFDDFLNDRSDI